MLDTFKLLLLLKMKKKNVIYKDFCVSYKNFTILKSVFFYGILRIWYLIFQMEAGSLVSLSK